MLYCEIFMKDGNRWFIPKDPKCPNGPRMGFKNYPTLQDFFTFKLAGFIKNAGSGWYWKYKDIRGV